MDRPQDKTVVLTPQSGGGGSQLGNALPNGYVLQGRYIIEAQLGAGGFGITYLAKHRYLEDIWVAIKEYLPEGAAVRDETSRVHAISEQHDKIYSWGLHRFLDEARLLRQFQHPNIVSVDDFFEANDTAYMVMNYVRGRSIQNELDAGREFSEQELRNIVYQLLDALNHIHRNGLFHRDISPDNILLREEDDSPVLIDFGSARYEMRMHGAERADADKVHTPTTIFKQGYSPIEQYEGTPQGPYTDIYAFAATLYRIAFGTRAVDALKRSGEIRLTQTDPLVPAAEKGKGKFSSDFLRTIDVGLQLDPAARPQTVDEWLKNLEEVGTVTIPGPVQAHGSRRKLWAGVALAGLLGVGVVAGGFLWYTQRDEVVELPGDVPTLLARATQEFEASPFDEAQQNNAREYYLQILNLDGFNTRALAGLSAANLLQDFNHELQQQNRANAVVLLDGIETEFKRAGIDIAALESGWQRLELLNKLAILRDVLPEAPLSTETWGTVEGLIVGMRPLPGGDHMAGTAEKGLEALKSAHGAVARQDFDTARRDIGRAKEYLADLGVDALPTATRFIDEQQDRFEKLRLAQITDLMQQAEQVLLGDPLTPDAVRVAADRYDEILALDEAHSGAQVRRTFVSKLLGAYDAVEQGRFGDAREIVASAHKVAANAGFSTLPADRVQAFVDRSERDWATAQTRSQIRDRLAEATRLLDDAPLDKGTIRQTETVYREALADSGSDGAFAAERQSAENGIELAAALNRIAESLGNHEFAAARTALSESDIREWARDAGHGPTLLARVNRLIDEGELTHNAEQAVALLNGDAPFSVATLDAARENARRMIALAAEDPTAVRLTAGLDALVAFNAARTDNNFPLALGSLQQALGELEAIGVDVRVLTETRALVEEESATWNRQQRELQIGSLQKQAFDILAERPLTKTAQSAAGRVFNAIGSIEGGSEHAAMGEQLLTLLAQAQGSLERAEFDAALKAIEEAEPLLGDPGGQVLASARAAVAVSRKAWADAQRIELERLLGQVAGELRGPELGREQLMRAAQTYDAIAGLHEAAGIASAGRELVGLIGGSLNAARDNDFVKAEEQLDAARKQLPRAGLDASTLDPFGAQIAARGEHWATAQRVDEINTLLKSIGERIGAAPLDDPVLKDATEAYSRALELNETLDADRSQAPRITAGLEVVFLLRAFAAELADGQFDALTQSITELRGRLPAAGLDESIAERLQRQAADAEVKWRTGRAREYLLAGDWTASRDLGPAVEQIGAAARIAPDQASIGHWQQGLRHLQQAFDHRSRRRFDDALEQLDLAGAQFDDLGLAVEGVATLRAQVTTERERWHTLSIEREIVAWTGEAVAALNRAPFAQQSWDRVEALVSQIFTARRNDERALTLQQALASLRAAAASMQSNALSQAGEQVRAARQTLGTIGLANPLQRALDTIAERLDRQYAAQLRVVADLLGTDPVSDDQLDQALAALEQVNRQDPSHPVVTTGIATLHGIRDARLANRETRYAEASRLLAETDRSLANSPFDSDPLPALRELLKRTRTLVAKSRPGPGEIYPIISVGLRKIADNPLEIENLDAAESLLRNALGLQADEEVALNALRTIEQLRGARAAIDGGDADAARTALQQAQQFLTDIGLKKSTLRAAWQQVEQIGR